MSWHPTGDAHVSVVVRAPMSSDVFLVWMMSTVTLTLLSGSVEGWAKVAVLAGSVLTLIGMTRSFASAWTRLTLRPNTLEIADLGVRMFPPDAARAAAMALRPTDRIELADATGWVAEERALLATLEDGAVVRWDLGPAVADAVLPEILPVWERARAGVSRSSAQAERDRTALRALSDG